MAQSFAYSTSQLSLRQLSHIFSLLKANKTCLLKGKVFCSSPQIIELLTAHLVIREPPSFKLKQDMLGKTDLSSDEAKNLKYKRTINFLNRIVTTVFVNEYKQKLSQLGTEFNLYLQREGPVIRAYSATPISPIFESQILDMKHKLKWMTVMDSLLYQKLNYSKYIRMELENMHIKFIYLNNSHGVTLHSSVATDEILKQAASKLSYDVIILQFYIQCYSPLVNKMYFKALMYHCEPFLNQISSSYEIKTEICWKKMGIVMHTPVLIFAEEPKALLSNFLANIIFVVYFTQKPSQHLLYISSHQPASKCVRTISSREIIYTSWDLTKQIKPTDVIQVFQNFLNELNINTKLRIGFRTGGLISNLIQKVEDLAEKHKLFIECPEFLDNNQELQVKFKSFSNRQAKKQQISEFLQELLAGKVGPIQSKSETSQSVKSEQNNNDEKKQVVISLPKPIEISLINDNTFEYTYQTPQLLEGENFSTKKGQRNQKLEDHLFDKYGIVSKIWNARIYLPKESHMEQNIQVGCSVFAVTSFEIESGFRVKQVCGENLQKLRSDQQYYLVSKIQSSPPEYFLTHLMTVYDR